MALQPWTVEQAEYLISDRWLKVRAETCRTADGTLVKPFYVLEYPDWVHIILFDEQRRILMNRQYRHARRAINKEIVCGTMDPADASPLAAAQRELLEETGYTAERFEALGTFHPNPATHANHVHCFAAFGPRRIAAPKPDSTEEIESEFVPITTILEWIDRGEIALGHQSTIFLALRRAGWLTIQPG